ncbi:MAG: hypothetical protein ACYSRQ_04375 [Planctomycetota bacterium]
MAKPKMPHAGHDKHLCYLINTSYHMKFDLHKTKGYKDLVKEANFICKACGRVAVSKTNLCKPAKV